MFNSAFNLSLIVGLALYSSLIASEPFEHRQLQVIDYKLVGEARYKLWGFGLYDSQLLSPSGHYVPSAPYALKLTYLRAIAGKNFASVAIRAMRKQGYSDEALLAKWHSFMLATFPNVNKGDTITAYSDGNRFSSYSINGTFLNSRDSTTFNRAFFDIWLGEKATNKRHRDRLLNR